MLRKYSGGKKIILIANKLTRSKKNRTCLNFIRWVLVIRFLFSAINGYNSGDLLDEITKEIPVYDDSEKEEVIKFAIIGKPNAGKSSITNALLNEEKAYGDGDTGNYKGYY